MVERNWDTRETIQWVSSEPVYLDYLKRHIKNELAFMVMLKGIILDINSRLEPANRSTLENVNGNEVYIDVNKIFGIETTGWCGNETACYSGNENAHPSGNENENAFENGNGNENENGNENAFGNELGL